MGNCIISEKGRAQSIFDLFSLVLMTNDPYMIQNKRLLKRKILYQQTNVRTVALPQNCEQNMLREIDSHLYTKWLYRELKELSDM